MTPTRILLIDPGTTRAELNEPLGIGALAASLEAALGDQVSVDLAFVPLDGPVDPRRLAHYDLVGLSTPLGSLAATRDLAAAVQHVPGPERPLFVLGGLLATFAPEQLLAEAPGAVLAVGEGEDVIVEIVRALRSCGGADPMADLARIPNVVLYLDGVVTLAPRALVDLSTAAPPRRDHMEELVRRQGIVRAESSRGCAWGRCTFCAIQHKYADQVAWRQVPIERVVAELEALSSRGVRHPFFTDEDFIGGHPERAVALAGAITQARAAGRIAPDLTLYVDMRVDSLLRTRRSGPSGRDVLMALKRAGLREVFVGIESGAADQVRRYKKPATRDRNLRALALLRALGLTVDVGFILFDPEMTLPEIRANLDFLRQAGLWDHDARMTKELRVEAGTPLVDIYRDKGLLAGSLDVDELLWPTRWVDPAVEAVHRAYRAWEALRMDEVYAIQSATRGEVPSPAARLTRRQHLGRIRAVEHACLEHLAGAAEAGREPTKVDLSRFSRERDVLLAGWRGRLSA